MRQHTTAYNSIQHTTTAYNSYIISTFTFNNKASNIIPSMVKRRDSTIIIHPRLRGNNNANFYFPNHNSNLKHNATESSYGQPTLFIVPSAEHAGFQFYNSKFLSQYNAYDSDMAVLLISDSIWSLRLFFKFRFWNGLINNGNFFYFSTTQKLHTITCSLKLNYYEITALTSLVKIVLDQII